MASNLVLGAILVISFLVHQLDIFNLSALLYLIFSSVLSFSSSMLLFRYYSISSDNDILIRVIVFVGAAVCIGIWIGLTYPVFYLLSLLSV